ncbi:glucose-6-phosphate 1-dehydrogenase [Streptomyces albidoflavus]|uniref:Glucose-6-phosphate 1-dehydrogenase n=2 Tax=Streptomyces TaxID=1883 RepID=A0AA37FBY8_9ACTN|nr:glucose-6-phosphate 1-dehydrogenase [Streptomyces albidoflavus]
MTALHGANPLRDAADRRLPRIAGPSGLVIFGVTGDLSRKKLMPAVYDLANRGLLPPGFSLIGFARREWQDQDFAEVVHDAVKEYARTPFREEVWQQLAQGMRFVQGTFDDDESFETLKATMEELDKEQGTGGNFAFYLSVPPKFFPKVVQQLKKHGLADAPEGSWRRAVIEKPFGHDLASARELNEIVHEVFAPDQVFRIDHYLGKETVQNILALRFANTMFEPLWNRSYVDHVQITMAEDIGIGGRAGYYDGIGAARDVIQNHLLQLMALTAMEEPASFEANALVAEKAKVLGAVRLPEDLGKDTVRAQYSAGWQGGEKAVGYLEEEGINPRSKTDTYAAVKLEVDNRRWAGVPFYLRTGKRLGRRVTEIAVVFQRAPHSPFDTTTTEELGHNALVIRVQPDEGVTVRFGSKVPGTSMEVRDVSMDFAYGESFTESSPEAYERLILDVLLGDANLFPRTEEVELSWRILDPIEEYWDTHGKPAQYRPAGWGPRRRTRCSHETDGAGAGHEDRSDGHHLQQDQQGAGAGAPGDRHPRRRHGADPGHRHRRGERLRRAEVGQRGVARAPLAHPGRHQAGLALPAQPHHLAARRRDPGGRRRTPPARTVILRLYGEIVDHAQSVVLPLLLPDAPVVAWWAR